MIRLTKLQFTGLAGIIIFMALNIAFRGTITFLLTLIITIFGVALVTAGHHIVPMLTRILHITYTKGEYEFPPGQEVVLRRRGNKYMAAKYLLINIPEKEEISIGEEMSDVYIRDFESALTAIDFPVRFTMVLAAKDITKFREDIQAGIYEMSLRIKKEMEKPEPDVVKIDSYQKKKEFLEAQLRRLAEGVKPMAVVFYAMTVAEGLTKKEAADKVKAQARELKAIASNNLNADVIELKGEDVERLLEWETGIPPTIKDLYEEVE